MNTETGEYQLNWK